MQLFERNFPFRRRQSEKHLPDFAPGEKGDWARNRTQMLGRKRNLAVAQELDHGVEDCLSKNFGVVAADYGTHCVEQRPPPPPRNPLWPSQVGFSVPCSTINRPLPPPWGVIPSARVRGACQTFWSAFMSARPETNVQPVV